MQSKHLKSLYFSAVIFLILFMTGFLLSRQKLIWNDELFTQQSVIETQSYFNILTSRTPDGNKNPLFYFFQKAVCDAFRFHIPPTGTIELFRIRDIPSEIIMRIPSDVYMSLALAMIFYFFYRFFSIYAAFYALTVALASEMVWSYWVEARPYSLWFLLTTMQALLFCTTTIAPKIKTTKHLLVTHLLLALTTPMCLFQIFIVTVMLWLQKRYTKKQLAIVFIFPLAVALFYYAIDIEFKIKTYMFYSNFFDGVMPERLFVYIVYGLTAWVLPKKYKEISYNIFFLPVYALFVASAFFLLFIDVFTVNSIFGFFSRYLIYVLPIDIIMYTLVSIDMFLWSRKNIWVCMNVSIFLGGLVIMRGLITYRSLLAQATYLHSP